jgi:hypothetical protein
MGPPHRKIDYEIYYDSGIDNWGGWLGVMKTFDLVRTIRCVVYNGRCGS